MTTDNLPALMDGYSDELAEMMGMGGAREDYLPRLFINKDHEDDDGNEIPPGSFAVSVDGVTYFSKYNEKKETDSYTYFRPFVNMFRIEHWGKAAEDEQVTCLNKTIFIPDWNVEMIDEKGGTRCGKIKSKDRKNYTEQEIKDLDDANKQNFRYIWGEVSMHNAVDNQGNSVDLEPTPCVMKLRGTNFMPFDEEVITPLKKKKLLLPQIKCRLTHTRHKNGDVVYYVIGYKFDMSDPQPITNEDSALLRQFMDTVKGENTAVREKYEKAVSSASFHTSATDFVDSLENDFHDDVSDLGT